MVAERSDCYLCGHPRLGEANTLDLCPRCLLESVLREGPVPGAVGGRPDTPPPAASELSLRFGGLEFLELIGRGGMAAVYKARQRELGRLVAVKVFPRLADPGPALLERFRQEAQVLARLSHPGIIRVFDFRASSDYCCLIMELADGPTLRQKLRAGRLKPRRALEIALQVCRVLRYAHRNGVAHRDIKPENILLPLPQGQADAEGDACPQVRVADFGLIKLLGAPAGEVAMTATGLRLGTAHYMAPEQFEAPGHVDHRADIYSLGVVLYEMLTGELPIGRFPPPSRKARVGSRVDKIVLRCLERSAEGRFADAGLLEEALDGVVGQAATARPGRGVRRLGLAAAAVTAVAAAAGIWWSARHKARTGPAPPPGGDSPAPARPATADEVAPEFRLPYANLSLPQFAMIRDGRAAFLKEMAERYGPARIAMFWVHGLPGDVGTYVHDEVMRIAGTDRCDGIGALDSLNIVVAPVDDVVAAAGKLTFGRVINVDPQRRIIRVQADPNRLPPPLRPDVTDPADPDFYTRNLEDLTCWDRHRRRRAAVRLIDAPPTTLRMQIAAALGSLLTDPSIKTREAAAQALGTWGGPRDLPALEEAAGSIPQAAGEAMARIRQRAPEP